MPDWPSLEGKLAGTDDLGSFTGSATGSLGEQLKQLQDLLDKVVGTTNIGAVTGDVNGSVAERLQYIVDAAHKGAQKLQGSGTLVMPAAASPVSITDGGGAWANGSYVEIKASTSEADYLLAAVVGGTGGSTGEVDIATGGAGSETVIATVPSPTSGTYLIFFNAPLAVPTATRLAARGRDGVGGGSPAIRLLYCKQSDMVAL